MTDTQQQKTSGRPGPQLSIAQMLGVIRVEFHRARSQRYPLCCAMIAVDGLQEVSQARGFQAKESVMRAAYELLKVTTRELGFFGMAILSGDRIMAVFPNVPPARMSELGPALVERARAASRVIEGQPFAMRLSIGASHNMLAETNSSFEGLVEMAGRALYLATEAKGDRYVMWREAETEIAGLRADLQAEKKIVEAERALLVEEASEIGGLQQAEIVHKIEQIFASVARTTEIDELQRQIVELAVKELFLERRKAVAAQMAEHQRRTEMLERRIGKLTSLLGVTEEQLKRVMAMKNIDAGVASIYRTVQGLADDDSSAETKKAMMADIFKQNLTFQKKVPLEKAAA